MLQAKTALTAHRFGQLPAILALDRAKRTGYIVQCPLPHDLSAKAPADPNKLGLEAGLPVRRLRRKLFFSSVHRSLAQAS
ncbi:MAG: hypothetical protein ACXW00_07005 [Methylobacter sp.]